MIILTADRIRDMLSLSIQSNPLNPANPLNVYYKSMLGFNFSLLGLSAFTLIGLNRLINEDIKRIGH